MTIMEEEMRMHRGEGKAMIMRQPDVTRGVLNNWLEGLIKFQQLEKKKESGIKPVVLPPLPPPPTMPDPQEEPAPKKSTGPLAAAASGVWGCGKCRNSKAGCLQCCPEKALRYANKKEAEAGQKAKEDQGALAKVQAAKAAGAEKWVKQEEAEKMAKQDEAAGASVKSAKHPTVLD